MVIQAVNDLPKTFLKVFVLRKDMPGYEDICEELKTSFPGAIFSLLPGITEGQACSALIGMEYLEKISTSSELGPVTVGACDNGALYDAGMLEQMMSDEDIDVIVWGVRGHPNAMRHPNMFGWINAVDGKIKSISVKNPLKSPASDPIIIGTFTFRRAQDFRNVVKKLIARDGTVNGEFYIDSCINDAIELGLNCQLFEVSHFISWGTPNDLKTFEYWQSCFHKWADHPYQIQNDHRVNIEARDLLLSRFYSEPPKLIKCR